MKEFPIIRSWERQPDGHMGYSPPDIRAIPWSFIAPHGAQAYANHRQTLERLAERGGLSPCEAVAVLEDRPWRAMAPGAAAARLRALVTAAEAIG